MKNVTLLLILFLMLFSLSAVSAPQEGNTTKVDTAQVDSLNGNEGIKNQGNETDKSTGQDMTILILGFGLLVIIGELIMVKKMKARWTPYSVIRMLGLTLIIISALALVAGSEVETQITAVIGLLGTLAGYLLGKDSKETDKVPE